MSPTASCWTTPTPWRSRYGNISNVRKLCLGALELSLLRLRKDQDGVVGESSPCRDGGQELPVLAPSLSARYLHYVAREHVALQICALETDIETKLTPFLCMCAQVAYCYGRGACPHPPVGRPHCCCHGHGKVRMCVSKWYLSFCACAAHPSSPSSFWVSSCVLQNHHFFRA